MPNKLPVKAAILDLYNGIANVGINGFKTILDQYRTSHQINLEYQVFDVRQKEEMPGPDFDIYFFSGGPGSPLSENESWDIKLFELIDQLTAHNLSDNPDKKYGFFVCHSFQLMCRHYQLGEVNMRRSPSFGVLPVHLTDDGRADAINKGLDNPFYAIDSRGWQVINPDEKRFAELGFKLLAMEKKRPHVNLPRAMMAIRFGPYFIATQFHPEAGPQGMKDFLQQNAKSDEIAKQVGEQKYQNILALLDDPAAIAHTQKTLIPNFLGQAITTLQ